MCWHGPSESFVGTLYVSPIGLPQSPPRHLPRHLEESHNNTHIRLDGRAFPTRSEGSSSSPNARKYDSIEHEH
jgi:hypothetical protein